MDNGWYMFRCIAPLLNLSNIKYIRDIIYLCALDCSVHAFMVKQRILNCIELQPNRNGTKPLLGEW